MSLIVATRFNRGVLLTSDPFVFDNDGVLPRKRVKFDRFLVSQEPTFAMAAVGSGWVFQQAQELVESRALSDHDDWLSLLSDSWRVWTERWKRERQKELEREGSSTLRPVSDSIFVLVRQEDLCSIVIGHGKGKLHQTSSFVISGSGSIWVRDYLAASGQIFDAGDTLEKCFILVADCYRKAQQDLYVVGLPSVVVVTDEQVLDLSGQCERLVSQLSYSYFQQLADFDNVKVTRFGGE